MTRTDQFEGWNPRMIEAAKILTTKVMIVNGIVTRMARRLLVLLSL